MLIDDNKLDNFFHERVVNKQAAAKTVLAMTSGREALDYIISQQIPQPEIIFLDINMPGMNGWEFIELYKKIDMALQTAMIVVMLTASQDPDDKARAVTEGILSDFKNKPLTAQMLNDVLVTFHQKKQA